MNNLLPENLCSLMLHVLEYRKVLEGRNGKMAQM